ncbi:TetR/AcrR family transcriptional regulator [Tissierella carlieri]|uniref:TetR/AcrR family transcriptional regulator n=1 Tax=Tissierella carlieri TaxID=689904 RepID=A0ABT1SDT7_9FIRM|nr:TetR/AcrR family transcriptional regulator [Tissierella carlieri]MCQ4924649.1 TetR/AcrR family transcriptional regulator [Tissierella carlieri]
MPKELFYQLNIDKRNRIINAGLSEFVQHSYNEASTNSIVKKASIGKGSLFKYFVNKEELYFYILDYVIDDFVKDLKDELPKLKGGIFQFILTYAEAEFNWYIENIDKYNLIKRAFNDDNSSIYNKTVERYKLTGSSFYNKIMECAEIPESKWEKERVLNIIKWVLEGLNEKFIKEADQYTNINDIKDRYMEELRKYVEILKKGLYY